MATKEDKNANAEYIRMADEIVDVPGGPNNNNYANVMLIVEQLCAQRRRWSGPLVMPRRKIYYLTWIGRPLKSSSLAPVSADASTWRRDWSTIIAQSAGVSCIGWNGDQLR